MPKLGAMKGKKYPEPLKLDSTNKAKSIKIVGTTKPLLEVRNLVTRFPVTGGMFRKKLQIYMPLKMYPLLLIRDKHFHLLASLGVERPLSLDLFLDLRNRSLERFLWKVLIS